MHTAQSSGFRGFLGSRNGLAVIAALAFGGYYVWTEYPAFVISALPFVLLLGGCLVMHLFMHHGGHGGHGEHKDTGPGDKPGEGGSR